MKKGLIPAINPAAWALALMPALVCSVQAAGPFTVNITTDSHAVSAGASPNDSAGHISVRSAIEAANAQAGATTINIPPATYSLSLGELDVATNGGKTITIQASGGNAANTILNQTDGINRVFNIDPNSLGTNTVTISGVSIQGGHDQVDIFGGAGILAGSVTNTPKDVLTLSGCIIANNHCTAPNTNYTSQPGGGVQMAGGDLIISGCVFSNNTSAASMGGGIAIIAQTVASSLTITGSTFTNNGMTNISGSGPNGAGAIYINTTAGSFHTISSSTFSGNSVIGTFGNAFGGAIDINTGTLNISNSTFTGNSASGQGAQGGAIYVDSGTANISFCRIDGNTATNGGAGVYNHGSNGANTIAQNDWWGCNGGPGATGCDTAVSDGGTLSTSPYIVLSNTASPGTILFSQSTTLTASFLQNSAGTSLTLAQISVLLGLPVTWGNAALGTLSTLQTTIQPNGMATATYTAGSIGGTGSADARVDNGTATATIIIPCATVIGTVSGGGSICPGGSAIVSVAVSGGTPPYSVTLDNSGGTQAGSGPFFFTVSPSSTTIYHIASGQDAHSCSVVGSGSATVNVGIVGTVTILPSPTTVYANSSGNQASAPAGFASYAWTISNGAIIGPANSQTISYVAGVSGNVTLGLTALTANGCSGSNSVNVPIVTGFSIHTNVTFIDALTTNSVTPNSTTMGIAFDGTNYWSVSGDETNGNRLAQYGLTGALIATYSPGLDFRSVFTKADGTVLARAYNSPIIYQQTSPGVMTSSGITLTGGTLDQQASVALNGAGTEFIAMSGGVVSRWDTGGNYLGSVTLQGFGTLGNENVYPQNRGIAAFGNVWLTYDGGGHLSMWDFSGNRLLQAVLPGAGTSFDSDFSFSYCNGKVFIVDVAGGTWRGYDIFSSAAFADMPADTDPLWNSDVTNKISGVGSIPRLDMIRITTGDPVPTLAQLRSYSSVLVYSDLAFNDEVAMGNVLADYVDQGGGVVMSTFAFATAASYGIQGRINTGGYLPFTTGSVASPGGLTLVKDVTSHPVLDGVNSFNGGTSSYQNSPITNASGATEVAHWSNLLPLVDVKASGQGRVTGLNFYPPSSDARSDFWVAGTDGARLMANALLWSGRVPPTIVASPADQVVKVGGTAAFNVTATGISPLSYQWRLNGTNIPTATGSSLSFTVQTNSMGFYSVVVSNLNGATVSMNATLSPPLRFQTPVLSGGALPLVLQNSDGSSVASNRASRVQLYSVTGFLPPLNNWTLVTNPVTFSNGLLRVDGLLATNATSQFFRAQETP